MLSSDCLRQHLVSDGGLFVGGSRGSFPCFPDFLPNSIVWPPSSHDLFVGPVFGRTPRTLDSEVLRIASWNINGKFSETADDIWNWMHSSSIDILLVQDTRTCGKKMRKSWKAATLSTGLSGFGFCHGGAICSHPVAGINGYPIGGVAILISPATQ